MMSGAAAAHQHVESVYAAGALFSGQVRNRVCCGVLTCSINLTQHRKPHDKIMSTEEDNPAKKPKLDDAANATSNGQEVQLVPNGTLSDIQLVDKWKTAWKDGLQFKDENLRLDSCPFKYGELTKFVEDTKFLENFVGTLSSFEFAEKANDLFQFRQSDDLKAFADGDPYIFRIMEYLSTHVRSFLKDLTGLPLNDTIDLFLSDYRQTDFLLCHDDELDSRRIAFILYLSKEWKPEFGGGLDLFSSVDYHPDKVVKTIVPEFNKFVFFEVGAKSFHQVSEVVEPNVSRIALSGWFYGDPVPRPKIEIPCEKGYLLKDSVINRSGFFKQLCGETYMDSPTQSDINEQLAEESEVLIPGFLRENVYTQICKDIVDGDVERNQFEPVGPCNIASYQQACKGPPKKQDEKDANEGADFPNTLETLRSFFHSTEFLEFMEKITEFPFTSCDVSKVTSSLKKFTRGSFSLLRSGGTKHTGIKKIKNLEAEDNEEEEEEEPQLVDVSFYFASKWDDEWGGLKIYSAEDGEQLISVSPEGNCLAVVVRNSMVNSYVNYINCLAKEQVYFVYSMTFAFDGNL